MGLVCRKLASGMNATKKKSREIKLIMKPKKDIQNKSSKKSKNPSVKVGDLEPRKDAKGGVNADKPTNPSIRLYSSRSFKQDIADMGSSSNAILSLRPVSFRYRPEFDGDGVSQFGLVAEDVEQVSPNLVVRGANGVVDGVRYEAVNAMLLNEFLKEHARVAAQAKKISSQQAALKRLAQRVTELERRAKAY
jgi:hypothetical protein